MKDSYEVIRRYFVDGRVKTVFSGTLRECQEHANSSGTQADFAYYIYPVATTEAQTPKSRKTKAVAYKSKNVAVDLSDKETA